MIGLIAFGIVVFVVWAVWGLAKGFVLHRRLKALSVIVIHEVDTNADAIVRNYNRLRRYDEYGNFIPEPITQMYDDFMRSAIYLKYGIFLDRRSEIFLREVAADRVTEIHIPAYAERTADIDITPPTHHRDFENWCCEILIGYGWKARVTGASGDQGADIIATNDTVTMVVQCKRYTSPVGNKAVQEVVGARAHYQADKAIVVSVSGYTPSAKALAATNGVLLIDAEQLAADGNSCLMD